MMPTNRLEQLRSDSDELQERRLSREYRMSFAEKCNVLAIRTACADEWSETVAEWFAWAKGCDVPENFEARRALGNLLEALGARMQRSTRRP